MAWFQCKNTLRLFLYVRIQLVDKKAESNIIASKSMVVDELVNVVKIRLAMQN